MARNPYFVPAMIFACSILLTLDIIRIYIQVTSHMSVDDFLTWNMIIEVEMALAYIFATSASLVYSGEMDPGKYSMRIFGLFAISVAIFYVIIMFWLPLDDHLYNVLLFGAILLIMAVGVFFVRRSYELKPLIPFIEPPVGRR
jgi:hypothetical protein